MTQEMKEAVLQKLKEITNAWKALQFVKGHNPDIPLQWSIEENILFLDGIWICPTKFVSLEKLNNHDLYLDEVCISIGIQNGYVDIIVTQEFEGYAIRVIERRIPVNTTN